MKGANWVGCLSEGLAMVERNGFWGYINRKGETVIPFKYQPMSDEARGLNKSNFENGRALVSTYEETFYIDKKGKRYPFHGFD